MIQSLSAFSVQEPVVVFLTCSRSMVPQGDVALATAVVDRMTRIMSRRTVRNGLLALRSLDKRVLYSHFGTPDIGASDARPGYHHLKNRPTMFPARVLANPPPLNAPLVRLEAWLNLSHLEKATVFVIVRTRAITISMSTCCPNSCIGQITYNDQPYDILQSHYGQHCQPDP